MSYIPRIFYDKKWQLISEYFVSDVKKAGRPVKHSRREILDVIFIYFVQPANDVIYHMIFPRGKLYLSNTEDERNKVQ
jgi:hypothetical protein